MRKISLLAFALSSISYSAFSAPKNIIYMIGDGMGPAYVTGYRYFKDDPSTKVVERTIFDELLLGTAQTYPDDDTYVTDSAAGATALATGIKSYNGAVAVDTEKKPLLTMLEIAKANKMTTALVATSQINHATPASFTAHNESRRNYDQIANDYIDNKINGKLPVDLLLGGGVQYFERADRNLTQEFIDAGYSYHGDFKKLNEIEKVPALGLFHSVSFPFAIDKTADRLTQMTAKTLQLLEKSEDGFFVMIEGSQIDWCGHANDIACAMAEMDDFANSITLAKQFVDKHPDTLLVITADHSTGGLTLGANGDYQWHTDVIKQIKGSVSKIAKALAKSTPESIDTVWHKYVDFPLSDSEKATLLAIKNDAQQEAQFQQQAIYNEVNKIFNTRTNTGWTSSGHTAVDVPVMAYGKGKEVFVGNQNNTEIAQKLIHFINH